MGAKAEARAVQMRVGVLSGADLNASDERARSGWQARDKRGRGYELRSMTRHATRRAAQRNVAQWMIHLTLQWGRAIHTRNDGTMVLYLGWRELERLDIPLANKERAEGTTLVMGADESIITLYRDKGGPRHSPASRRH